MLDRPEAASQPSGAVRRYRAPARAASDASEASPIDGAAILAILRRRKWLLLASILLCPLLGPLRSASSRRAIPRRARLLYDASEYKVRELQSILRVDPITDAVMASQAEVLRGMPVVEQVAEPTQPARQPGIQSQRCGRRRGCAGRSPPSHRARCAAPSPAPADGAAGTRDWSRARNATLQRGAGRADGDSAEGVARAGGFVHRGGPGDRCGGGQHRHGLLREVAAGR